MYKLQVVKSEKPVKPPKPPKPEKIKKPRQKWSRKKKIVVVLAVVALLVGGTYYVVHQTLTGPAIGTVISTIPANSRQKQVELEQFDGKLISFVHPITFVEQIQKLPPQNSLETHTFVSTEMVSQVLVMTITSLPTKNPEDDPSYKMRTLDKAKYHMKQTVVKNEKVIIFTSDDSQQMQQAGFWVRGDKLLTMVLSGVSASPQETTKQYNAMLSSITWH